MTQYIEYQVLVNGVRRGLLSTRSFERARAVAADQQRMNPSAAVSVESRTVTRTEWTREEL